MRPSKVGLREFVRGCKFVTIRGTLAGRLLSRPSKAHERDREVAVAHAAWEPAS